MALLSQVVEEYLEWLELDRHASAVPSRDTTVLCGACVSSLVVISASRISVG